MQYTRVKSTSRLLQLLVGGMALHRDTIRGVQRGAAACLCLPPRQAHSAAAAGIQPSKSLLQRSKNKKQPKAFETHQTSRLCVILCYWNVSYFYSNSTATAAPIHFESRRALWNTSHSCHRNKSREVIFITISGIDCCSPLLPRKLKITSTHIRGHFSSCAYNSAMLGNDSFTLVPNHTASVVPF